MSGTFKQPQLTDYQFAGCVWTAPDGARFLLLPKTIVWYFRATSGTQTNGIEQSFDPDYDVLVKSIGGYESNEAGDVCYVQVQWPDGRYLSNPGLPVWDFIGTGLRGFLLEQGEIIPRGQKVKFNVDNSGNEDDTDLALYFEGVVLIPMVEA